MKSNDVEVLGQNKNEITKDRSISSQKRSDDWYVVYCKHNCEKKLYDQLTQLGYEAFLPTYNEVRQWSDRKKKIEVPLIKNVIFLCINASALNLLYEVPYVQRILKEFGKPAVVRNYEIENLKIIARKCCAFLHTTKQGRRTGNGESISISETQHFNKGDNVCVKNGPFKNIKGELIEFKGKERILVKIQSMQVSFILEVKERDLESE